MRTDRTTTAHAIGVAMLAGAHHSRNAYEAAAFELCRDALGVLHAANDRQAYALAMSADTLARAPSECAGSSSLRFSSTLARAILATCDGELDKANTLANVAHAFKLCARAA